MKRRQRGGFVVGLIVGLLLGLVLALGVALYVTKVPVPFVNKVPQRTAEQDAAETERNRDWDPNAALSGRSPSARAASAPIATPPVNAPAARAAATAAPIKAPGAVAGAPPSSQADPFGYFVQAGAYARIEDAEQQRARLAMLGYAAKVTEREQAGRIVYRVRLGPFEGRDDADSARSRLQGSGIESALVRVQR